MDAFAYMERSACAPSGPVPRGGMASGRMSPELRAAQAQVVKLQRRIAKAQMAGRRGKVRALQRLLTHSRSARLLAAWTADGRRRGAAVCVVQSDAARRLGRDGMAAPALPDNAMLALHALALEPLVWALHGGMPRGLEGMRAMRSGQSRSHAEVRRAADALGLAGACALRLRVCWRTDDARARFAAVPGAARALTRLLRRGLLPGARLYPDGCRRGELPEILAELAMSGLKRMIRARFGAQVCIARCADELIAVCPDAGTLGQAGAHIGSCLPALGLRPAGGGAVQADGRAGIEFAGFRLRRSAPGHVELSPSRAKVRELMDGVQGIARSCQARPECELARRLDGLLSAWARDYAGMASRRALERVDLRVRQCLWRWALKRHPRKGKGWIYARYFGGAHVNAAAKPRAGGALTPIRLYRCAPVHPARAGRMRAGAGLADQSAPQAVPPKGVWAGSAGGRALREA